MKTPTFLSFNVEESPASKTSLCSAFNFGDEVISLRLHVISVKGIGCSCHSLELSW